VHICRSRLEFFGPRRLGVAGEHPRARGVPRKVCNCSIAPPQGKESSSGRSKKELEKTLARVAFVVL
jgi:hypothetical protein